MKRKRKYKKLKLKIKDKTKQLKEYIQVSEPITQTVDDIDIRGRYVWVEEEKTKEVKGGSGLKIKE